MSSAVCLRPELQPLTERMRDLSVDARGYVVPWFVAWIDTPEGRVPEFRAVDRGKFVRAIKEKRCWVCGKRLGSYLCFVIGPMCGVNRVSSEPPSHLECGEWSARNCPFLSKPQMVRREGGPGLCPHEVEEAKSRVAGNMIERNPGVTMLWVTHNYSVFDDGAGKMLLHVGDPERVWWYANGRLATREEVKASVDSGLPILLGIAEKQKGAVQEVMARYKELEALYPV